MKQKISTRARYRVGKLQHERKSRKRRSPGGATLGLAINHFPFILGHTLKARKSSSIEAPFKRIAISRKLVRLLFYLPTMHYLCVFFFII